MPSQAGRFSPTPRFCRMEASWGGGRHGAHPAVSPSRGTSGCRAPCWERGASRALGMLAVQGEAKLCHRASPCPADPRPASLCCRVPEVMRPRSRRRAARGSPRTPRPRWAHQSAPRRRPPGAGLTCASASACRGLSSPTRPLMVPAPAPRPRRRLLRAAGMELGEAAPPCAASSTRCRPWTVPGTGGRTGTARCAAGTGWVMGQGMWRDGVGDGDGDGDRWRWERDGGRG